MPEVDPSKPNTPETLVDTGTTKVEVEITPPPEFEEKSNQFSAIRNQVIEILSELPDILLGFFNQYRKAIVTLGLIVATFVTIKVMLAVIDALNDIPFLAPTFELIGIVYFGWFVYRYLINASDRQELWAEVQSWKDKLIGDKTANS